MPPTFLSVQSQALNEGKVVEALLDEPQTHAVVGCGHALLEQKIAIVDPETATLCPPDRVGEIWVSGTSIARGYWRRAEESQKTFQAFLLDTGEGPFLRTGDLGFYRDDDLFI